MLAEKKDYLTTISIYLTEYCNLNCRHCWIDPKFTSTEKKSCGIDFNDLKRVLKEAIPLGLKKVKLTGGEPFLNSYIIELMEWLHKNEILINMETNGTLITEKEAKIMK
ncbi:radical SAM protein, partial [Elusimicrobiota bacterium]